LRERARVRVLLIINATSENVAAPTLIPNPSPAGGRREFFQRTFSKTIALF
jgi:hypothetical protein